MKESARTPEHRKYATGDGRVLNDEEVVVVKEVGKKTITTESELGGPCDVCEEQMEGRVKEEQ